MCVSLSDATVEKVSKKYYVQKFARETSEIWY